MRVLIACEFSGIVREAFLSQGHNAWSCDILPSEIPGNHIQTNVLEVINDGWNLMIAHPPCTDLAVSGSRWFKNKGSKQLTALELVLTLLQAPITRIALENPISVISTKILPPSQIIHPHQFGHPEFKTTCLWLKNLPILKKTNQLKIPTKGTEEWKAWCRVHQEWPSKDRWKNRSRTYKGIAEAMASQWGKLKEEENIDYGFFDSSQFLEISLDLGGKENKILNEKLPIAKR